MMPNSRLVAVAGAAALILVGCSSPKVTFITPTSATKTSTVAAQPTESSSAPTVDDAGGTRLDGEACVAVT